MNCTPKRKSKLGRPNAMGNAKSYSSSKEQIKGKQRVNDQGRRFCKKCFCHHAESCMEDPI